MVKGLESATVTVKQVIIPNKYSRVVGELINSNNTGIKIGVINDLENAIKAYTAEVGNPEQNVPARPFLTEAFSDIEEVQRIFDNVFTVKNFDTFNVKPAIKALSKRYVKLVKNKILDADNWALPNQPETVDKKKKSGVKNPHVLRWTDDMLKAITYQVIEGSRV
jgi:hypothetical protein